MRVARTAATLAFALWTCCCGPAGEGGPVDPEPVEEEEEVDPLVGAWQTEGVDPALGPVTVLMELREDGGLRMALLTEGGGQRSFPGDWEREGTLLVLKGVYFEPSGERRVRWRLNGEGELVLEEEGREQVWRRQ